MSAQIYLRIAALFAILLFIGSLIFVYMNGFVFVALIPIGLCAMWACITSDTYRDIAKADEALNIETHALFVVLGRGA